MITRELDLEEMRVWIMSRGKSHGAPVVLAEAKGSLAWIVEEADHVYQFGP